MHVDDHYQPSQLQRQRSMWQIDKTINVQNIRESAHPRLHKKPKVSIQILSLLSSLKLLRVGWIIYDRLCVYTNPVHVMWLLMQMIIHDFNWKLPCCNPEDIPKPSKPTYVLHITCWVRIFETSPPEHPLHLCKTERPLLSMTSSSAPAASSIRQTSTRP